MTYDDARLSAYLDGELSEAETRAFEEALAVDADLQAQLEALMAADDLAREALGRELDEPVPPALAAAIEAAPGPEQMTEALPRSQAANAPNPPRRVGLALVAAVAGALLIGGAGGFYMAREAAPVAVAGGWLADIADYHAVYATQVRHLVEVPAEEADHIETWLTATLGAAVTIPDLADQGLTFEGGRLLVAAGRPVAQLIYTDAGGAVVALCQIASGTPQAALAQTTLNGFEMVSWGGVDANFVIVADEGRPDLQAIVSSAAGQV